MGIQEPFAAKVRALRQTKFAAFQLSDPTVALDPSKAHPMGEFDTLQEAQMAAAVRHKQRIMIREREEYSGATVLHFYQVKQRSQPIYVRKPGMAHTVAERPLYLEHLFDLDPVAALAELSANVFPIGRAAVAEVGK